MPQPPAVPAAVPVQAYSITSTPVAKALMDAHSSGVKVEAVLDRSNQTDKYSSADLLSNMGIPVRIDAKHAIAHKLDRDH
jgi:hypothetical protein